MDSPSFSQFLEARTCAVNSLLCVGLDPHISELPAPTRAAAVAFCRRIVDATVDFAAAFKPNVAFFERLGAEGILALQEVLSYIPNDIPIILDAKRGDIGSTSEAYATVCLSNAEGCFGAHSVTINPYMGFDSIEPFTKDRKKGTWILCKTSNPGSNDLQILPTSETLEGGGSAVYEHVAHFASNVWNANDNVGLVVGATDVEAIEKVRAVAPTIWLLCPGVGAQGGDLGAACNAGLYISSARATGIIFPVSRSISKSANPGAEAQRIRDEINSARALKLETSPASMKAPPSRPALMPHQIEFIESALQRRVLRFGEFSLKSGRSSPYFFNTGLFATGAAIAALGKHYASSIMHFKSDWGDTLPDVIFGPAYKGIPLATTVGVALATYHKVDIGVTYNRKEAKDHGEGGTLVGHPLSGCRVLLIDDVITAGTAIREAVGIVSAAGGTVVGAMVALDRQERSPESDPGSESRISAVMSVSREFGFPVHSIIGLSDLCAYFSSVASQSESAENYEKLEAYRREYGVC